MSHIWPFIALPITESLNHNFAFAAKLQFAKKNVVLFQQNHLMFGNNNSVQADC